jgi:hypothetical protein
VTIKIGDVLKSKINEDLHEIRRIEDGTVILEHQSGFAWITLKKETLDFYFEKVDGGNAYEDWRRRQIKI